MALTELSPRQKGCLLIHKRRRTLPHRNSHLAVRLGSFVATTCIVCEALVNEPPWHLPLPITLRPKALSIDSRFESISFRHGLVSTRRNVLSAPSENDAAVSSAANAIYSQPALYDLAFGYRDFDDEVSFLLEHAHAEAVGRGKDGQPPLSRLKVLELAAGPGRHALGALQQPSLVHSATAVDINPLMRQYSLDLFREQQQAFEANNEDSNEKASTFEYIVDDMRYCSVLQNKLSVNDNFDTVWILLGSLQHLLLHEDLISCFEAAYNITKSSSTLILELPHPKELFSLGDCTKNEWIVPLVEGSELSDGDFAEDDEDQDSLLPFGNLHVVWGDDNDSFDPLTQVRQMSISMTLRAASPAAADDASRNRDIAAQEKHSSNSKVMNDEGDPPGGDDADEVFMDPIFVSSELKSGLIGNHDMAQLKNTRNEVQATSFRQIVATRLYTFQEILAAATATGWGSVRLYGALDSSVIEIDNEIEAYRMICVFTKRKV
jgi:hypothetical protein